MTHPDTSTTRGKIEVMEAFERGEKIESARQECGDPRWTEDMSPTWNWSQRTYRIVPKPSPSKYRPWKMEEVPVGEVVVSKLSNCRLLIVSSAHNHIRLGQNSLENADALLADFTLLDGSPCGVREEVG